jgi:hypothetical protein
VALLKFCVGDVKADRHSVGTANVLSDRVYRGRIFSPQTFIKRSRKFVLRDAANVQGGEAELEDDQRVGVIVPAPGNPEDIAQEEKPEAPLALGLRLSGNEIRRDKSHGHRRPLQVLHPIHRR